MLTLANLFTALRLEPTVPNADTVNIRKFVIDSREAQLGDVFVALPGEKVDGHRFVDDAFKRGAIAAIVQNDVVSKLTQPHLLPVVIRVPNTLIALQQVSAWWRAGMPVKVIGITGSIGKTTTKELIAQVLSQRYNTLKNEGNLNNEIGLPLTLLNLRPTHERAVLEMGMYAIGEITELAKIARPYIGVITLVAPVHLERMGSIENIAKAKSELVESLPEDGFAILNDDDERVRAMAQQTPARVVTYGLTPRANIWAENIETYGLDGISLDLCEGKTRAHVRVPLLGRHSAQTILRAATVGRVEGMSWGEIIEGLAQKNTPLRIVTVEGPLGSVILDDTYNASSESVIAALNLLADLNSDNRIAVLGDMLELGDVEEAEHRLVGCRAAQVAHTLICVGQRARWIADEAISCGAKPSRVIQVANNAEAVLTIQDVVTENSVILIKGSRGMQMEEIVQSIQKDDA
jgi:UDP-N-acetylmuramoyl-tripeptide--D-alanyl-D-alanine ligase